MHVTATRVCRFLCRPAFDLLPAQLFNGRQVARSHARYIFCSSAVYRNQKVEFHQEVRPSRKIKCYADPETKSVVLSLDGATFNSYPYVYLRDSCLCEQCHHPTSKARSLRLENLDLEATPKTVQTSEDGYEVSVVWSDGHFSVFPVPWLHERAFTDNKNNHELLSITDHHRLWGREMTDNFFRVQYSNLFSYDFSLVDFITALLHDGVALVENAPKSLGTLTNVLYRLGIPKRTHYGEYTFQVESKVNPVNLAYTPSRLNLHNDLVYYEYCPGTQLLHCIRQHKGDGGENHLVDGFRVATQLKEEDPDAYKALVSNPVIFEDIGKDCGIEFLKVWQAPIIELDAFSSVKRVNFNNPVRSSLLPIPLDQVRPFYRAVKKFHEYCYQPRNLLTIKLKEGDILAFNNLRVLHGREAYAPNAEGDRLLEGGYVDWDDILSRLGVLRQRLGPTGGF